MGGDYVESPSWSGGQYVESAAELAVKFGFASPEVVQRLHAIAAAYRYVEKEFETWRHFVQSVESMRASGSFYVPTESMSELNRRNFEWIRGISVDAQRVPPPVAPPEVQKAMLKAVLESLVSALGRGRVAVALSEVFQEKNP